MDYQSKTTEIDPDRISEKMGSDPKPETVEQKTTAATTIQSCAADTMDSSVQRDAKAELSPDLPISSRTPPAADPSIAANRMTDGSNNSRGRSSRRQVEDETPMSQTELRSFLNEVEKQRAYFPSSASLPPKQIQKEDQGEAEDVPKICNTSVDETSDEAPDETSANRCSYETDTITTADADDPTGHTSEEDCKAAAILIESKLAQGQHPQLGAFAIGGPAASTAADDGSVVMHEGQNHHVLLEATLVVEQDEELGELEDGASNKHSGSSGQLGSTESSLEVDNHNHHASLIVEAKPLEFLLTRKTLFFGILLTALASVALITGFMITRNKSSSEKITPILQQVAERGVLRCGVNDITKARSELIFGQPEFMPETIVSAPFSLHRVCRPKTAGFLTNRFFFSSFASSVKSLLLLFWVQTIILSWSLPAYRKVTIC